MMRAGEMAEVLIGHRAYRCEVLESEPDGALTIRAPRNAAGHTVPLLGQEMVQVMFEREDGKYTFIGRAEALAGGMMRIWPQSEAARAEGAEGCPEGQGEELDFDLSLL